MKLVPLGPLKAQLPEALPEAAVNSCIGAGAAWLCAIAMRGLHVARGGLCPFSEV